MAGSPVNIQQAFDRAYAERAPVFGTDPDPTVAKVASLLPEGARVLDAGCGDGRNSLFLLEQGFQVQAVDFAPSGIRHLEKEASWRDLGDGLETATADIRGIDLSREEFDAIVSTTVLENLSEHEQLVVIHRWRVACRRSGFVAIEAHTDRDPAASPESDGNRPSEFGDTIISPVGPNELLGYFPGWRILSYYDEVFEDATHGEPHDHGRAGIVAQRPEA